LSSIDNEAEKQAVNEPPAPRRRKKRPKQRPPKRRPLLLGALCLLGIPGCFLFVSAFGFKSFSQPAASSYPTLVIGDKVYVNKWKYLGANPARGDLVVYESPDPRGGVYIHRVLAIAGDELVFHDGHPAINRWEVPHCLVGSAPLPDPDAPGVIGDVFLEFLEDHAYLTFHQKNFHDSIEGSRYILRAREYFVVGDNRFRSYDSRFWLDGGGAALPRSRIKGRVSFVWWGGESGRLIVDVTEPHLPPSLESLADAYDKCMKERPPVDKTTPPPPPTDLPLRP
jgi:signal peptidase I